jgi:pseudouridine synthase
MTIKIPLTKFIANSGYCSRRRAEKLIREGRVFINGKTAALGQTVAEKDNIEVNGKKIILAKEKIYIIVNKPTGITCTNKKFPGEKNIFSLLPKKITTKYKLHVAGRLDKNSRGLVLLTNDGNLTERLTHPRYEHKKIYELKTKNYQPGAESKITYLLIRGVDIGEESEKAKAYQAKYLGNGKFKIVLTEGKKRQLRRMFKNLGYEVADLKRTAIGELKLGNLKKANWRFLTPTETKKLFSK